MNPRKRFRVLLLMLSAMVGNGCATHALWNKTNLDAFNQPADMPNLRLFQVPSQDFLVVYDEYSERSDSIQTRAYFLNQNQKRVLQKQRPQFVNTNRLHDLRPVPVFAASYSPATLSLFVLISTNHESFTLYAHGRAAGAYELPVYNDGKARLARIALTPVAVAADLTIVGGVVGCWVLVDLAKSGYSWP